MPVGVLEANQELKRAVCILWGTSSMNYTAVAATCSSSVFYVFTSTILFDAAEAMTVPFR
jgi:hypothetical protein